MKYTIFIPQIEGSETAEYTLGNMEHIPRVGDVIRIDEYILIVDEVVHNYNHSLIWIGTKFDDDFIEEVNRAGGLKKFKESLT